MSQPGTARADRLRAIALERVAEHLGYQRDPNDRARWKRPGSVISITQGKFYDHIRGRGGGGAIDLAIHASGCPFRAALDLLEQIAPEYAGTMPGPKPELWQQVQRYLTRRRGIDPELIDHCHQRCLIDVDRRANALFVTRNADGTPTGAELHGTRPGRPFKGMAPGSRKAQGGFWIARRKSGTVLLTESAINALSALSITELGHVAIVISTAGVATRLPYWTRHLNPENTMCGYDADKTGDTAAQRLIENHPGIRRMRSAEGEPKTGTGNSRQPATGIRDKPGTDKPEQHAIIPRRQASSFPGRSGQTRSHQPCACASNRKQHAQKPVDDHPPRKTAGKERRRTEPSDAPHKTRAETMSEQSGTILPITHETVRKIQAGTFEKKQAITLPS